jgi:hypothetical protein
MTPKKWSRNSGLGIRDRGGERMILNFRFEISDCFRHSTSAFVISASPIPLRLSHPQPQVEKTRKKLATQNPVFFEKNGIPQHVD